MRSLRSVTLAPIGMPSRSLKSAIDVRALVITGFWPAISARSSAADWTFLEVGHGFADAHVQHDLVEPRDCQRVGVAELLRQLRHRPRRGNISAAAGS